MLPIHAVHPVQLHAGEMIVVQAFVSSERYNVRERQNLAMRSCYILWCRFAL